MYIGEFLSSYESLWWLINYCFYRLLVRRAHCVGDHFKPFLAATQDHSDTVWNTLQQRSYYVYKYRKTEVLLGTIALEVLACAVYYLYLLWFNFILGSNFFLLFQLIIMLLSHISILKNKRMENLNQG